MIITFFPNQWLTLQSDFWETTFQIRGRHVSHVIMDLFDTPSLHFQAFYYLGLITVVTLCLTPFLPRRRRHLWTIPK